MNSTVNGLAATKLPATISSADVTSTAGSNYNGA